jgi:hypothetical protein
MRRLAYGYRPERTRKIGPSPGSTKRVEIREIIGTSERVASGNWQNTCGIGNGNYKPISLSEVRGDETAGARSIVGYSLLGCIVAFFLLRARTPQKGSSSLSSTRPIAVNIRLKLRPNPGSESSSTEMQPTGVLLVPSRPPKTHSAARFN